MRKKYTNGKWHGLINFKCLQCKFRTLDEEQMIDHVKKHPALQEIVEVKPRKVRKKIELVKHVKEQEKGLDTWQ